MSFEAIEARITAITASPSTPIGLYRFADRLGQFIPHLKAALGARSVHDLEGAGQALYASRVSLEGTTRQGRARDALFALEALCRVYRKTVDKEVFEVLRDAFKELEDALGRVDYHDGFREDAARLEAPAGVQGYFTGGLHVELQNLTKRLEDSEWLDCTEEGMLSLLLDEAEAVDWPQEEEDRDAIIAFLCRALEKLEKKAERLDFGDLEQGTHEFRRALRWILIYPKGLAGMLPLVGRDTLIAGWEGYYAEAIVASPYNDFPVTPRRQRTIGMGASYVYALNTVISAMGELKDHGQREEAFVLALRRTGMAESAARCAELLGPSAHPLDEIPQRVQAMVKALISEHRVLERMRADLRAQGT